MNQPTIEDLSNEKLLEIFEYLDTESLMNAVLVCRRWKDIIYNYSSTMKNLPVVITSDKISNMELECIERKIHTVKFDIQNYYCVGCNKFRKHCVCTKKSRTIKRLEFCDDYGYKIENMLKFNSENVREITITNSVLTIYVFATILLTPKVLDKLVLVRCNIESTSSYEELQRDRVKTLVMVECNWHFLPFFYKTEIKNFKFFPDEVSYDMNCFKIYTDFLSQHKNIEDFIICSKGYWPESSLPPVNNFKLKRLVYQHNNSSGRTVNNGFLTMLLKDQPCIEHLEITSKIFSEECLEILKLPIKFFFLFDVILPSDFSIFKNATPNLSLRELEMNSPLEGIPTNVLFRYFPNIETLTVNFWREESATEVLLAVSTYLKNIKTLKIPSLWLQHSEISIPTLRNLHICDVMNFNELGFVMNNPGIEKLYLERFHFSMTLTKLDALTKNTVNLEILALNAKLSFTDRMRVILQRNCPKFQKFLLCRNNLVMNIILPTCSTYMSGIDPSFMIERNEEHWKEIDEYYSYYY